MKPVDVKCCSGRIGQQAMRAPMGEGKRRKGKIYPFECRVPKNSKER